MDLDFSMDHPLELFDRTALVVKQNLCHIGMRNDRYLASADDSRLASQFSQYLISYALAAANISLPFAIKTWLVKLKE